MLLSVDPLAAEDLLTAEEILGVSSGRVACQDATMIYMLAWG